MASTRTVRPSTGAALRTLTPAPHTCPACNNADGFKVLRTFPPQSFNGEFAGKAFNVIRRESVACPCGQTSVRFNRE